MNNILSKGTMFRCSNEDMTTNIIPMINSTSDGETIIKI